MNEQTFEIVVNITVENNFNVDDIIKDIRKYFHIKNSDTIQFNGTQFLNFDLISITPHA